MNDTCANGVCANGVCANSVCASGVCRNGEPQRAQRTQRAQSREGSRAAPVHACAGARVVLVAERPKPSALRPLRLCGSLLARVLPERGAVTARTLERVRGSARAPVAFVIATLVAACGANAPKAEWVERDGPAYGQSHATGEGSGTSPSAGAPLEIATLDAAGIDRLDEATLLIALQQVGDAAPAARLALRAARLAHHRGDAAEARAMIARAANAADEATVHTELAALAVALAAPPVDPNVVAVLLPLTGRFSSIGSELRVAIQLAPASGTTWLFLDTRGEPDGAIAAVEAAVAKGAVGILGPVGQREAIVAARAASFHQLPIALLAPADGADPAAGVFRLVDSPADEGREVARLAASESFPTVGVFAPRDDLGQEAADAFIAEATKLGLTVTGQGAYDPTSGDLEADVKKFLNLIPALNPRLASNLAKNGK